MYRIALQLTSATPTQPATYQFLTDTGVEPWETESEEEGLARYCSELDNYRRSLLSLIKMVDVECTCVNADNTDTVLNIAPESFIVRVNDGNELVISLDLSLSELSDYTAVTVNEELGNALISSLEEMGLTDIELTTIGVRATNPTSTPITNNITFAEGMFRLYSKTSRQDNYISSEVTLLLNQE